MSNEGISSVANEKKTGIATNPNKPKSHPLLSAWLSEKTKEVDYFVSNYPHIINKAIRELDEAEKSLEGMEQFETPAQAAIQEIVQIRGMVNTPNPDSGLLSTNDTIHLIKVESGESQNIPHATNNGNAVLANLLSGVEDREIFHVGDDYELDGVVAEGEVLIEMVETSEVKVEQKIEKKEFPSSLSITTRVKPTSKKNQNLVTLTMTKDAVEAITLESLLLHNYENCIPKFIEILNLSFNDDHKIMGNRLLGLIEDNDLRDSFIEKISSLDNKEITSSIEIKSNLVLFWILERPEDPTSLTKRYNFLFKYEYYKIKYPNLFPIFKSDNTLISFSNFANGKSSDSLVKFLFLMVKQIIDKVDEKDRQEKKA
jgi:hypothetical protein